MLKCYDLLCEYRSELVGTDEKSTESCRWVQGSAASCSEYILRASHRTLLQVDCDGIVPVTARGYECTR